MTYSSFTYHIRLSFYATNCISHLTLYKIDSTIVPVEVLELKTEKYITARDQQTSQLAGLQNSILPERLSLHM